MVSLLTNAERPLSAARGRVLVVSNSGVAGGLVEMCCRLGCETTLAHSYADGLRLLSEAYYNLVVMEAEETWRPQDVVRSVRGLRPGVAVAFVVNCWSESDRERGAAQVADWVIKKPIRPPQVQTMLRHTLGRLYDQAAAPVAIGTG